MHPNSPLRQLIRTGRLAVVAMALAVGACASSTSFATSGAEFAALSPSRPVEIAAAQDYRIGPLDKLNITVFQVKDLSLEKIQVDAGGRILMPLIGSVNAGGKTTTELSQEIATRLGERYLQNPQVSVIVEEAVSQKVTVEGAVVEAGVFPLKGRTTLLQAVAMAKGPKYTADLRRVAVFRQDDGKRMAAVFDLAAVRAGRADDPEIMGDDVVVVGESALRGSWREIVQTLPALGIFAVF